VVVAPVEDVDPEVVDVAAPFGPVVVVVAFDGARVVVVVVVVDDVDGGRVVVVDGTVAAGT
jgi:hypothetical protein